MFELQVAGLILLLVVLVILSASSLLMGADTRFIDDGLKYDHRSNW